MGNPSSHYWDNCIDGRENSSTANCRRRKQPSYQTGWFSNSQSGRRASNSHSFHHAKLMPKGLSEYFYCRIIHKRLYSHNRMYKNKNKPSSELGLIIKPCGSSLVEAICEYRRGSVQVAISSVLVVE